MMMTMIVMDDDDDYDNEVHPLVNSPRQFSLKNRIEMFLEATVLFSTARLVCVIKIKGRNPCLLNVVCYAYINQSWNFSWQPVLFQHIIILMT